MTDETLRKFKNNYENERIFLVGNGPSLDRTPLNKLKKEHTLSMNRISHIYSETSWRPSIYYNPVPPNHSADGEDEKKFINDNIDEANICFINSEWEKICGSYANVYYFDRWWIDGRDNPFDKLTIDDAKTVNTSFLQEFWSDDISNFVYHYHSMYGAIQLAVYLGFDEIYFIGCDLGFKYMDPHMIFDSGLDPYQFNGSIFSYINQAFKEEKTTKSLVNAIAMKLITSFGDNIMIKQIFNQIDNTHFTSDYLSGVNISHPKKSENEIRKSHIAAKRICEKKGTGVYNATIGGELEVYERIDLEKLL